MTAVTPAPDVQAAMYTRANGDATLGALINGVFDHVPEGTSTPYVKIGELVETPENAHDRYGRNSVVTWHVWTGKEAPGYSSGLAIASRLIELFDHQSLTVSGHSVVSVRFEFLQTLTDPDPDFRHVPVRFRVVTEQT